MLKLKHRHPDADTGLSVTEEERIREDERRRVLAELAAADSSAAAREERRDGDEVGDDADWRHAPPPAGETPSDPGTPTMGPAPAPVDPRRWDLPDDRSPDDEPTAVSPQRTATGEMPVTSGASTSEREVVERGFSPGQILLALAGLASLAFGIVALARTGLARPLDEPVEPVLGWDHTAQLALIEIGVGVILLLCSLRAGLRWLGGLVGLAVLAGGILIVGQFDGDVDQWIIDELGAERGFGWLAMGLGAIAVLSALIPRVRRTRHITT